MVVYIPKLTTSAQTLTASPLAYALAQAQWNVDL